MFSLTDSLTGGIDFALAGNGGPDCVAFIDGSRRVWETCLALIVCLVTIGGGYANLTPPKEYVAVHKDRGGKRVLLIVLSLVWGIEIGFKFATQSLIFLLNPCHVTTGIQIYLLAAPPTPSITWLFRVHMNFLNGAILAILFPVTNTRLLSFESEVYWIQHLAMLVVPYYLLRLGGVYTVEDLSDFGWNIMSYGILLFYHFVVLQGIGLLTEVNLNNMVCPAISDPFYGPNYRLGAIFHQMLMVPLSCKLYSIVASYFLTRFSITKVKDKLESDLAIGSYSSSISCVSSSLHQRCDKLAKEE